MKRGRALGSGRLRARSRAGGKKVYEADYRDAAGERRRKILGTDRRVAERRLAELIRKRDLVLGGLAEEERPDTKLEDLLRVYGDHQAGRCKSSTIRDTRRMICRIAERLGVECVEQIELGAYLRYRARRQMDGLAAGTLNREHAALGGMLRWAEKNHMITRNPLASVETLRETPKQRRALSDEEVRRFLLAARQLDHEMGLRKAADKTIRSGAKDKAYATKARKPRIPQAPLWLALIETGARFSELVSCTWSDLLVDQGGAKLRLRAEHTKSTRERWIPLRADLAAELAELRTLHGRVTGAVPKAGDAILLTPTGLPWLSRTRNALTDFRSVCELAGIEREDEEGRSVNIHALRHTFAARLARSGVGLVEAQKLLGHSDPKLTMRVYTHVEVDQLRSAIDKVPSPEGSDVVREAAPAYVTDAHWASRPDKQVLTLAVT